MTHKQAFLSDSLCPSPLVGKGERPWPERGERRLRPQPWPLQWEVGRVRGREHCPSSSRVLLKWVPSWWDRGREHPSDCGPQGAVEVHGLGTRQARPSMPEVVGTRNPRPPNSFRIRDESNHTLIFQTQRQYLA